jgi:hypothetical protein
MKRLLALVLAVTFATPAAAAAADPRIAAALVAVNAVDAALVGDDHQAFADALAEDLAVNNPQNLISRRETKLGIRCAASPTSGACRRARRPSTPSINQRRSPALIAWGASRIRRAS